MAAAALVIDATHPSCDEAIDAAAVARTPVLAWAVGTPPAHRRNRLKARNIPLLIGTDARTLCRDLAAMVARAAHDGGQG